MKLHNKTAIVTGGASGFGKGIVAKFIDEGARVVLADVNEQAAIDAAKEHGDNAIAFTADVASASNTQALVEYATEQLGDIDIVVNNAGVTHLPMPADDVSEDDFDRVIAVNTKALFHMTKAIVPMMKTRGSGVILNVASTGGVSPRPNLTWYNASKGWLITATRGLAVELAPFGIRVNAINPVAGETPLLKSFMGEDTPQIREKFLSTIPLGRFSTPQDMGNAASFLCSDEASMITGVAMEVDGGRCI
jgi:3-oxoacyl-[acyl-carrier protein] reductase